MSVFALMLAGALFASDPDGVVTTAPATSVDLNVTTQPVAPSVEGAAQDAVPHGLSTDQQIDRWIAGRSSAERPWAESAGARTDGPADDRKMHSEFSAGIGTGGYRDYGMAVSLPLGESSRLDIHYSHVENGSGYGGYGYGYDPVFLGDRGYALSGSRAGLAAFEVRSVRGRRGALIEPHRSDAD